VLSGGLSTCCLDMACSNPTVQQVSGKTLSFLTNTGHISTFVEVFVSFLKVVECLQQHLSSLHTMTGQGLHNRSAVGA